MNQDDITSKPASLELIIYQISQLDKGVAQLAQQFKSATDGLDARVTKLELWQAGMDKTVSDSDKAPIDVNKIILGAFALVSAALALILVAIQSGWLKH